MDEQKFSLEFGIAETLRILITLLVILRSLLELSFATELWPRKSVFVFPISRRSNVYRQFLRQIVPQFSEELHYRLARTVILCVLETQEKK